MILCGYFWFFGLFIGEDPIQKGPASFLYFPATFSLFEQFSGSPHSFLVVGVKTGATRSGFSWMFFVHFIISNLPELTADGSFLLMAISRRKWLSSAPPLFVCSNFGSICPWFGILPVVGDYCYCSYFMKSFHVCCFMTFGWKVGLISTLVLKLYLLIGPGWSVYGPY